MSHRRHHGPVDTQWHLRMESNNPMQCQARTYLLDIIIVQPVEPQLVRRVVFLILYQNNNPSQTNHNLPHGEKPILYGQFLCWIGLWMLMGTIVSPQRRGFWATSPIDAFHGAPLHLGVWMMTEFRQPIQVQSHLEMPGILVQLGRIQHT